MSTATAAASRSSTTVRLGKRVHSMVKDYSEVTGIPLSKVLERAFEEWMSTVGVARKKLLTHTPAKSENSTALRALDSRSD